MNAPMWELCPKCHGEGMVPTVGTGTSPMRECPVCEGGLLIGSVNGQPRPKVTTISNTKSA